MHDTVQKALCMTVSKMAGVSTHRTGNMIMHDFRKCSSIFLCFLGERRGKESLVMGASAAHVRTINVVCTSMAIDRSVDGIIYTYILYRPACKKHYFGLRLKTLSRATA